MPSAMKAMPRAGSCVTGPIAGITGDAGFVEMAGAPRQNGQYVLPVLSGARGEVYGLALTTAKLNSVDPQAWLTDALGRIADHMITRLDELFPWRYSVKAA
jgi:hypothetical protein